MIIGVPLLLLFVSVFLSNLPTGHSLCSKNEFSCDVSECISKGKICDGQMNCKDRYDEIDCDITTQNTTNSTKLVNETSPLVSVSKHITTSPSSQPSNSKNTVSPTPTRWEKAKKFVKKKVYSKNGTKQRKNRRPLYRSKLSKWTKKQTSTKASDTTPSAGTSVTHCSVAECDHWRPCWRDVKRSRKCVCIEADCIGYWNASSRLGREDKTDMKDVFEWVAISLSSFGLVLATIILLLKRRRLRHNDTRPLLVRTVICYHNGQDDVARMHHGTAAEIHPLCENDSCASLVVRDQGQTFPI